MPEAKTIGSSASLQKYINLVHFLKLFLQDCSYLALFERFFACMTCSGSGVRVSMAPLSESLSLTVVFIICKKASPLRGEFAA
ncbi:hypothetical protein [Synechococcus sp. MIT S9504]|uniref:hypothetical protein n=1 Tax=Synechococcus sp. MIT S9504 TaxID=1801628 RepID=UPI0018D42A4A|nr:hypothetical protein [Synechococcus sp. MIT S9504]